MFWLWWRETEAKDEREKERKNIYVGGGVV